MGKLDNKNRSKLGFEKLEQREMLAADAFEQHAIYLVNRDRHEQTLPPLAVNDQLVDAASAKSADLRNCFDHVCDGKRPDAWASEAGYTHSVAEVLLTYFPPGTSNSQAKKAVIGWIDSDLHRDILRGDDNEIGIGRTVVGNNVYWAGHTGKSRPNTTFLTGVVFDDRNGNRQYDYGEGLSGVTVSDGSNSVTTTNAGGWTLSVTSNKVHTITAIGGSFGRETTTDITVENENRSLDFAKGWNSVNLDFSTHSAEREVAPSNSTTTNPVSDPSPELSTPTNPGNSGNENTSRGFIAGRVFLDLDENDKRSNDEESLANWVVYIDNNNNGKRDKGESQQLTDATGHYEFNLSASNRSVKVRTELKNNFSNTTPLGRSVVVQAGVRKTKDFGVLRNNEVSGFVFLDSNRDGIRGSKEAKLSNWTVFVDANGNGRHDVGERKDTTNKNGKYSFKSLNPGSHKFVVSPKNGFEFTSKDTRSVSIGASGVKQDKDFGVNEPRPTTVRPPRSATKNMAMISGRVFVDANGNAQRDASEALLNDWVVFVDANRNGLRDANEISTRTDVNGRYEFTLPVGTYRLGVEAREAYAFTTNQFRSVNTNDGVSKRQRDFGLIRSEAAALEADQLKADYRGLPTVRDISSRVDSGEYTRNAADEIFSKWTLADRNWS